jgi:predicted dehydrogenase
MLFPETTAGDGRPSRRDFLRTTAVAGAAAFAAQAAPGGAFRVEGKDEIRVGVVGCGGRGTGAAVNCLDAHPSVKIVALGDAFRDRLNGARGHLANLAQEDAKAYKGRVEVADDKCFVGYDAYKQVIAAGVDLVILATPPGFRPDQILAAAEAGKHVFAEKPVAVDPVGVRKVIKAGEIFDAKKLGFVTGTQRRHQPSYLAWTKQILEDKMIGDVVSAQVYWNQGPLWKTDRTPEMTDVEWQCRNWLYFTWLSGDHIVEQHVHNLDVMCWVMGGPPSKATGMGGRQVRVEPVYGHIYDHFAIDYEWKDGRRATSYCRQIDGTASRVGEFVQGTKGSGWAAGKLVGLDGKELWRHGGDKVDPYTQEHVDLLASIREGRPLNEARRIAESTLVAIMGRMSAYTGQEVSFDYALNKSQLDTFPTDLAGPLPVPPVAIPGRTKLA